MRASSEICARLRGSTLNVIECLTEFSKIFYSESVDFGENVMNRELSEERSWHRHTHQDRHVTLVNPFTVG